MTELVASRRVSDEARRSPLHSLQERSGASFVEWQGALWARDFGDPVAEHLADVPLGRVLVREIVLFESRATTGGQAYVARQRTRLGEGRETPKVRS